MNLQVTRAEWSKNLAGLKSELIKAADNRVKSCIKTGHHIEAIALLESMIADRLEAGLSRKKNGKQVLSTLGPLLNESLASGLIGEDFCLEIRNWSKERNKILHEMVKVRGPETGNWRERMKHARKLAIEGLVIYKKLSNEIRKINRFDS